MNQDLRHFVLLYWLCGYAYLFGVFGQVIAEIGFLHMSKRSLALLLIPVYWPLHFFSCLVIGREIDHDR